MNPVSILRSVHFRIFTLFLFSILLKTELHGQASAITNKTLSYTLTANIINAENKAIEIGNVLVLSEKDSSLIQGDIFIDGLFSIENISTPSFLLKITALGYLDFIQRIENTDLIPEMNLGELSLKPQEFQEVIVTARQQLFEQRGSDIIVNVANTSLQNAGSALDLIRNTPKVAFNSAGQISVLGKGNALIYLDGQQLASNQILGNISSGDIQSIEIIENPGAKYDAAGNAVINIITKSQLLKGYQIDLIQEIGYGKYFRSYAQANAYYRIDKLTLNAGFGIRPWSWGGRNYQIRTHSHLNSNFLIDSRFQQKNDRLDYNYSFKASYQMDSRSMLGFQYTGNTIDGDKEASNIRLSLENGLPSFNIEATLGGPYDQASHTLNTFYRKTLDTLGSNFQLSAQLSSFDFDRQEGINQILEKQGSLTPINRRSTNNNAINIYTFQADHQLNFTNGLSLQSGLKNAYITNKSGLIFEAQEGQNFRLLPEYSNNYSYVENIMAGYGSFNWQSPGLQISAGIRGEWTQNKGLSDNVEGDVEYQKDYFNLFPSFSINKKIKDNLKTSISYSYRVNRPTFQDLNPYVLFVDSLVSLRGNPALLPEFAHSFSGNINYKKLNLSLNYIYTKNKVNQIFRSLDTNDPGVIAFVKENLQSTELYSAALSFPLSFGKYSGFFTLGSYYDDHRTRDFEQIVTNSRLGFYFQANQSLQLPWNIRFDAIINYTSKRVDGIYLDNPISFVNLALSKKILNDQLTIRFWANDIFDDYKFTGVTEFNAMRGDYLSEGDWHFVKLSLNWNFGKLGTEKVKENKISQSELNRINANQD